MQGRGQSPKSAASMLRETRILRRWGPMVANLDPSERCVVQPIPIFAFPDFSRFPCTAPLRGLREFLGAKTAEVQGMRCNSRPLVFNALSQIKLNPPRKRPGQPQTLGTHILGALRSSSRRPSAGRLGASRDKALLLKRQTRAVKPARPLC